MNLNIKLQRKMSLFWPLLLGVATAFLISEYVSYKSFMPDLSTGFEPSSFHQEKGPSWEGLIFEKNVMRLDIPEQKFHEGSPSQGRAPDGWKLLGVFSGSTNMALVSISGEIRSVMAGETVGQWELVEILPHSIRWSSGHETVVLQMWHQQVVQNNRDEPVSSWSGSNKVTLSSRDVEPLLSDPNSLLQMARFSPHIEDGLTRGFEISSIRPGSMIQKLGIRNGDVLTRIDGRSITGPAELLRAYSSLNQSSLVTMDIMRRGANISLIVEIN